MRAALAFAMLFLAGCASAPAAFELMRDEAELAAPQPISPTGDAALAQASKAMAATCGSAVQNADREINFVCSLQSAELAHAEAGRDHVASQGCPPLVACDIEDKSLVVRILYSPATGMDQVPRASSLELTGFDGPRAHADLRELVGLGPYRPLTDAPGIPPPMQRGKRDRAFDLTPEQTKRILELAAALRADAEPSTWLLCAINPGGPQPTVVFSTDPAGAFIELYFGAETHAYLRNGAYYGKAGAIASLAMGGTRESPCRVEGAR
jgi:hypothetical protein